MPAHKRFFKGVTDPITLISLAVFLSSIAVGTYLSSRTDSFDLRSLADIEQWRADTSESGDPYGKDDGDQKEKDDEEYRRYRDDDDDDYTSSPEVNKEWGIIKELSEEGTVDPSDPKYDRWGGLISDGKGGGDLDKPTEVDPLPPSIEYTTVEECGGGLATSECFCTVQNCYSFDNEGNLLWAHGDKEKEIFKELIEKLNAKGMLIHKGNRLSIDRNLDGIPDDDLLDRILLTSVIAAVDGGYSIGSLFGDVAPTEPTTEDATEEEIAEVEKLPPSPAPSIPIDTKALEAYKDCLEMGGGAFSCSGIYNICDITGACDFSKEDLVDAGIITITEPDIKDDDIIPIIKEDLGGIDDSGARSLTNKY